MTFVLIVSKTGKVVKLIARGYDMMPLERAERYWLSYRAKNWNLRTYNDHSKWPKDGYIPLSDFLYTKIVREP